MDERNLPIVYGLCYTYVREDLMCNVDWEMDK